MKTLISAVLLCLASATSATTSAPRAQTVIIPKESSFDHAQVIEQAEALEDPFNLLYDLKRHGHNLDLANAKGRNLLMLAAEAGLGNVALALIFLGADTSLITPYDDVYVGGWTCINECRDSRKTAAQLAQIEGQQRLATILTSAAKIKRSYEVLLQLMAAQTDANSPFYGMPLELVKLIHKHAFSELDSQ